MFNINDFIFWLYSQERIDMLIHFWCFKMATVKMPTKIFRGKMKEN